MKLKDLLKLNESIDAKKLSKLVGKKVKRTSFSSSGTIIITFDDGSYIIFTNTSISIIKIHS